MIPPSSILTLGGAKAMFNLSASNELVTKATSSFFMCCAVDNWPCCLDRAAVFVVENQKFVVGFDDHRPRTGSVLCVVECFV